MNNLYSKTMTIVNELGLHARSAAQIVKIAKSAGSNIWLIKDGEKVDAASMIDILTLACEKGSVITIKIEDQSDRKILVDLQNLIENGFGE